MKNFKASLPATMAGLAAKAGLKLAFGQPRTNGKVVYVTPPPLNPDEKDRILILGDLIHEIAHVRETDFSVLQDGNLHPAIHGLLNVFEDVRIEKKIRSYYLGAEFFLLGSYDLVMEKVSIQDVAPGRVLSDTLLARYFWLVLGRVKFKQYFDQLYQLALGTYPAEMLKEIFDLCDPRVPAMKSTQDALALAEDLFELLKQKYQEGQQGDDPQDQQGETSEGQQGDDPQDQQGEASEGQQGDDPQDQQGGGNSKSLMNPEHMGAGQIQEKFKQEVEEISCHQPQSGNWGEFTGLGNKIDFSLNSCTPLSEKGDKPTWWEEVEREKARARTRFARLWKSTNRRRWTRSEQDGFFSHQEAVRCIASGEKDYLIRRTRQQDNRPAVVVLVDVSSSMNDEGKIEYAKKATSLINELAGELKFPLNILAYDDEVFLVKDWKDSNAAARERIWSLEAIGCTSILPAFWAGYVAAQNAPKSPVKIILITDGMFTFSDEAALKAASLEVEECHPIHIYGLGLGVKMHYLDKAGEISPDDLAESMLDILAKSE